MQKNRFLCLRHALFTAMVILFSFAWSLHAAYIPGVTATTTMGNGFDTNLATTVNAVGLTAPTLTATHAGTAPNNCWVSSTGVLTGTITFRFPQARLVRGFSFWNQNGGGPDVGTGIQDVSISYSNDGTTYLPLPGAPKTFKRVTVNANAPPETFSFPAVLATNIRFQVMSNYGDVGQTGFAEIAFDDNRLPTVTAATAITTDEDTAGSFTVTTADPEGAVVTVTFSTPEKGVITGSTGDYLYTPNSNANGADSFTITADDGNGGTASQTVNVTINPVNDAPTFTNAPEMLVTDEDTIVAFGVAAGDVDGDTVIVTAVSGQKGSVIGSEGSFTYTPDANAHGGDSFTLTVTDGNGGAADVPVNVTITPVNDAPVFTIVPDALTTDEDLTVQFTIAANDVDGDAITFTPTNGQKGSVSALGEGFAYTPNPNANGGDDFAITATDPSGGSAIATVSINITPINDAPVFTRLPATLTTNEDIAVDLEIGTGDLDGDAVTVTATNGQKGNVTASGARLTYTPNPDANGADRFTASVSDGNGALTSMTVEVTVTPVNDAPIITTIPTELTLDKDVAINFAVTTEDIDGDPVTVTFSGATRGIVSGSAPDYAYEPSPGAKGLDRFTVTAADGQGGATTAAVRVTIVAYPARYGVLLGDATGTHAALTLSLNDRGLLSGIVRDENHQRLRFRGRLDPGAVSTTVNLKDGSELVLDMNTRARLQATWTAADRVLTGVGNIALAPPSGVPARYTVALDTGAGGFGWCLIVVDPRGNLRISGKLPDASPIAAGQGMPTDGDGNAPLFLLGSRKAAALLSGLLQFDSQPESDVTGSLNFRKSGNDTACAAMGAKFAKAPSALPEGSYPLTFEGAGVSQTSTLILDAKNGATVSAPVISFVSGKGIGFAPSGVFTVKFRETTAEGITLTEILVGTGVFIQKLNKGAGQFVKEGVTGQVVIGE